MNEKKGLVIIGAGGYGRCVPTLRSRRKGNRP